VIIILILSVICSCKYNWIIQKKIKVKPLVHLKNINLDNFTDENSELLKRYLLGNSRWDYKKLRNIEYAVTRNLNSENKNDSINYYSENNCYTIISFKNYINDNFDKITFADSINQTLELKTTIENQTQFSSYLIIKGKQINIEIAETSNSLERIYTQKIIDQLINEFEYILVYKNDIENYGKMPVDEYYSFNQDTSYFIVEETDEIGKYIVKANYNFNEPGQVFIKVFEENSNFRLSKKTSETETIRQVGWSNDGNQYFYYEAEIRIYDGTWLDNFSANFEFWFRNSSDKETLLATEKCTVSAWKRSDN